MGPCLPVSPPRPHGSRKFRRIAAVLLLFPCAAPGCQSAAAAAVTASALRSPYADCVADAARRFGIPPAWIWAVMRTESAGNPRALSPVGAIGLMQIMPGTWTTLSARYSLGSDPYDPAANVHAGAAYLREMYERYREPGLMLAAYNAGPGRVDDWRLRGRPLPAETRAYVARILPAIGSPDAALAPPIGQPASIPAPASQPGSLPAGTTASWRTSDIFAQRGEDARMPADEHAQPQGAGSARSHRSELFVALSGQ